MPCPRAPRPSPSTPRPRRLSGPTSALPLCARGAHALLVSLHHPTWDWQRLAVTAGFDSRQSLSYSLPPFLSRSLSPSSPLLFSLPLFASFLSSLPLLPFSLSLTLSPSLPLSPLLYSTLTPPTKGAAAERNSSRIEVVWREERDGKRLWEERLGGWWVWSVDSPRENSVRLV